jgi:DNA-binding transcriptional ArsR family regulator
VRDGDRAASLERPMANMQIDMVEMIENATIAADFLKAIANPNRLMILCQLTGGERSVGELEELLGVRQPSLSQQLARLRADNLVKTRRDSKRIYYSLASPEAERLIETLFDLFCGAEGGATALSCKEEPAPAHG